MNENFEEIILDKEGRGVYLGRLPEEMLPSGEELEELWEMHPGYFHKIKIFGKEVKLPRWQQAYGRDYPFSGGLSEALAVPKNLRPYLDWARGEVHLGFNGLLVNWYEGKLAHYIGAHRDDEGCLKAGVPVLTISFGEERILRLRPYRGRGYEDFLLEHGSVWLLPWSTNRCWTHEVPHFARYGGRRISITMREFE